MSKFKAPLYDAKASIIVTVDFEVTGNISPFNLDHAVGSIQGVFYSNDVISRVQAQAVRDLSQTEANFQLDQFVMERYSETWLLRVRNSDPRVAAILVNLWREIGFDALIKAREHAVTARILQQYLEVLENCPPAPFVKPSVPPICQDGNELDEAALLEIRNRITQELDESHAIQPYLLLSLNNPAEIPSDPIQYQDKWMVLGGMLSFLVLGILVLLFIPIKN